MKGNNPTFFFWCWVAVLLSLPAFLLNLGLLPFFEDESIRALVALEMKLSQNYLVPTMNGSFYNSKPPLYNWILNLSYFIFGNINEWTSRFPTVIFTGGVSFAVYWFSKPYFSKSRYAILAGFFFLTCGRILFWDSFLGLIDICYSLVVFSMMMSIYRWGIKEAYNKMFFITYGLGIVAYFLKGMPVFLFIGFSLFAFSWVVKKWKFLFMPSHFFSIVTMFMAIGTYYFIYGQLSGNTMNSLSGLAEQSTMRTPLAFGLGPVIKHMLTYPFEYIFHYLPWTLFVVLLLRKDLVSRLKEQSFFYYCAVCFLANILVYWVSPQVYARYVLMLVPLTYLVFLYFYQLEEQRASVSWRMKSLKGLIIFIVCLIPIFILFNINHPSVSTLRYGKLFLSLGVLAMSLCAFAYLKFKQDRPILLVIVLLCIRIGFDIMVLPTRAKSTYGNVAKHDAIRIGEKYMDRPLQLYQGSKLDYTSSFYLTNTRKKITSRSSKILEDRITYILDTSKYELLLDFQIQDSIKKRENRATLFLIKHYVDDEFEDVF